MIRNSAIRSKLDVKDLRMVVAIQETQSVTEAGKRLFLSQSALSHQLSRLEKRLNTALFDRIGKRLVVTDAGHMVATAANKILGELESLEQRIDLVAESRRQPLNITASCFSYYSWLSKAVVSFTDTYADVDLQIHHQEREQELAALQSGTVDIIVSTDPPKDRNISTAALFQLDLVALISKQHELIKSKRTVRWSDLVNERIFIHDVPAKEEAKLREKLSQGKPSKKLSIQKIHVSDAIVQFARLQQGVGIVARWKGEKRLTGIATVAPEPREERMLWAAYLTDNPRDLPIDFLIETIKDLEGNES